MSAVHREIALAALAMLAPRERKLFEPCDDELAKASEYPDIFADTSMSEAAMAAIDPDAALLVYPKSPDDALSSKIARITERQSMLGAVPLRQAHLIGYYLNGALQAFKDGKPSLAAKLCAVYSHVIGDIGEPIHALHPSIVDAVLPPPPKFQGLELHACIEGLKAPVEPNRKPKVLGVNSSAAEMGAYAALESCRALGASLAVPIAKALYEGRKAEAIRLSSIAQSASSEAFADFLHTVAVLARGGSGLGAGALDLRVQPFAFAEMDMLYRYRPSIDRSLIPYSGGKTKPLTIVGRDGERQRVKGIGMIASCAPPFSRDARRRGYVEYYLAPGAFSKFRALTGLNPLFEDAFVPATFRVYAEERIVAETKPLEPGANAVEIDADIRGARWLGLELEYAANPSSQDVARLRCRWASHGVWAFPSLVP